MCNDCEKDYETMLAEYEAKVAELEARNNALEKALTMSLKNLKKSADDNFQLVVSNCHLTKKAYYAHKQN